MLCAHCVVAYCCSARCLVSRPQLSKSAVCACGDMVCAHAPAMSSVVSTPLCQGCGLQFDPWSLAGECWPAPGFANRPPPPRCRGHQCARGNGEAEGCDAETEVPVLLDEPSVYDVGVKLPAGRCDSASPSGLPESYELLPGLLALGVPGPYQNGGTPPAELSCRSRFGAA